MVIALALSMWQQRLWTLQESSLSETVYFQFKDGLMRSHDIMTMTSKNLHRPIIRSGHLLLDNLTGWVHANQVTVGGLQRNLYYRTSSKLDDESLAVAPFLNVDVTRLQEVHGESRMERFWSMVKHVPKAIVIHNAPKLSSDGFRWAPRSIMNQLNSIPLDFQDQSGAVTVDGLKGIYFVYSLHHDSPVNLSERVIFYDSNSDCSLICDGNLQGQVFESLLSSDEHVIVLTDEIEPSSVDETVGAVLSVVRHSTGSSQGTPMYRFEGQVRVGVVSKKTFPFETRISNNNQIVTPEMAWGNIVNRLTGTGMRATGRWTEIIIR
jgi:hypothetical protein